MNSKKGIRKKILFMALNILLVSWLVACTSTSTNTSTSTSTEDEDMTATVIISTSYGDIEVSLDEEKAPITTTNFLKYVDEEFYDGTIFHRVIPEFMIQGGGFNIDNEKKENHPPIEIESNNNLSNKKGTVAMARTSVPNSATSQFFINTVDNLFLDYKDVNNPGYAVFGNVNSGMDVVEKIEQVQTGSTPSQDWPVEQVIINSIRRK